MPSPAVVAPPMPPVADGGAPLAMDPEAQEQAVLVAEVIVAGRDVATRAQEVHDLVECHRFARLERHAAREHWSAEEPPSVGAGSAELLWWAEWRELQLTRGHFGELAAP